MPSESEKNKNEFEFDLPEVDDKKVARVHIAPGQSVCISCEG